MEGETERGRERAKSFMWNICCQSCAWPDSIYMGFAYSKDGKGANSVSRRHPNVHNLTLPDHCSSDGNGANDDKFDAGYEVANAVSRHGGVT